jgi:hypothetical protein
MINLELTKSFYLASITFPIIHFSHWSSWVSRNIVLPLDYWNCILNDLAVFKRLVCRILWGLEFLVLFHLVSFLEKTSVLFSEVKIVLFTEIRSTFYRFSDNRGCINSLNFLHFVINTDLRWVSIPWLELLIRIETIVL